MTDFTTMLSRGDLRSDGLANEVAAVVSSHPETLSDLIDAFASSNDSVRGHAADALEKVARDHPDRLVPFLPFLLRLARNDRVAMVRWHLAMVLGHMSAIPTTVARTTPTLLAMLGDSSPFVRSWAITGLSLIAQLSPRASPAIDRAIARLLLDPSPAVAKRARVALRALSDPGFELPRSWLKSPHVVQRYASIVRRSRRPRTTR